MNLKNVANEVLLKNAERLAAGERRHTSDLIYHLREIERRRLFSDLGYKSIYEYAVKHLKYSEDQSNRRVSAARLLGEVPEVANKIALGNLTLSNINIAHAMFRREKKAGRPLTASQKREFLHTIENLTSRQAEREATMISPQPRTPDRVRQITPELLEYKFTASAELRKKIEKLKGMIAHTDAGISMGELFEKLCDLQIEHLRKTAAPRKKPPNAGKPATMTAAEIIREVWRRDNEKCTECSSEYALQVDHIIPKAKGGTDTLDNLRLLCRNCNQRAAIKEFGQRKMDKHLRDTTAEYKVDSSPSPSLGFRNRRKRIIRPGVFGVSGP